MNTITPLFLLLLQTISITAMPMRYSITKNNKECLFTSADKGEYITASLFITDGSTLTARMLIQGPITSKSISTSAEVLAAGLRAEKGSFQDMKLNIDTDVDFESLYDNAEMVVDDDFEQDDDAGMDDVDDTLLEEYYYLDDDDEYEFLEDDSMDEAELKEIREMRDKRDRMSMEEIAAEKNKRREEKMAKLEQIKKQKHAKHEQKMAQAIHRNRRRMEKSVAADIKKQSLEKLRAGEPLQKTYQIEEEGWYRYCVSANADVVSIFLCANMSPLIDHGNVMTSYKYS